MTIDEILAEFGKRSGMENLGRDGNGVCRLVFDEIFDVDIELYDDQVSIFAIIGSVEDVDGGMLRVMLAANLDGADTGNATLAVDELSESVVLCRRLPVAGLTYPTFEHALEDFVHGFQRWRLKLDGHETEDDVALDADAFAGEPSLHMLRL